MPLFEVARKKTKRARVQVKMNPNLRMHEVCFKEENTINSLTDVVLATQQYLICHCWKKHYVNCFSSRNAEAIFYHLMSF